MRHGNAGHLPGAALAALAAMIILALAACGGQTESAPPEASYGPGPSGWPGPPYAGLCDMEALAIEARDADEEAHINGVLTALDIPLYITASLHEPMTRMVYDADEASPREEIFRWTLLSRYFSRFAPEETGYVEFGARVTASGKAAEDCWNAWLRRGEGEALPPVPVELEDAVSLDGGMYSIEPAESADPVVSLVFAYLDTDIDGRDILTVYADVAQPGGGEPYPVEIVLLRRSDGAYVLQFAGSANPEEDVYVLYELTGYRAAVYLPVDCELLDDDGRSASFASSTGLTIDVFEEALGVPLSSRRLRDMSEIPEPLFEFEDSTEFGIIWDDGANLRYHLVRQMSPDNAVCVQVAVPYGWEWDYFSLAESIFSSFGAADFPVEIVVGLEEYVVGLVDN
jgi:hypothetical protein